MPRWNTHSVVVRGLEAGVAGLCPASHHDRPRWYLATRDGWVRGVDFDEGETFFEARLPFDFPVGANRRDQDGAELAASVDGRFVAVMSRYGVVGALYDVQERRLLRTFERGAYHANVSSWAVAIVRRGGRDVLICTVDWNRLEAFALPSLERLVPMPLLPATEASLDYFFGAMTASPSGKSLASFGWVWQPVGAVRTVDVDAWLESGAEPPPGVGGLILADWWDDAVCWISETQVALIGEDPAGDDPEVFLNRREGVVIVNASTGARERFIRGIEASAFGCDGARLYALGPSTHVISLASGEVIAALDRQTDAWHPGARVMLSCPQLHGVEGACTVSWLTGLASAIDAPLGPPTPEALQVLADALEEHGADSALVDHCRAREPHGQRCWVLEALATTPSGSA